MPTCSSTTRTCRGIRRKSGTDAATLGSSDADGGRSAHDMLINALNVAAKARAQIRRPVGSTARVTIAVVDTNGSMLGMVRSRDAPVFGADVSLQKARTAALFSSSSAAAFLDGLPNANYLDGTSIPIGRLRHRGADVLR